MLENGIQYHYVKIVDSFKMAPFKQAFVCLDIRHTFTVRVFHKPLKNNFYILNSFIFIVIFPIRFAILYTLQSFYSKFKYFFSFFLNCAFYSAFHELWASTLVSAKSVRWYSNILYMMHFAMSNLNSQLNVSRIFGNIDPKLSIVRL